MVVGAFVCQMGLAYGYAFGTVADDVMRETGWTRTEYASALSFRIWINALANPILGWLTVRFGARPVLVGGVLGIGVGMFGVSRIDALWHLAGWNLLLGVVQVAVGDLVAGQAVAEWVRRWRGLALGVVYAGSNVGAAILVRLVAELSDDGWRDAILVTGLGGAAFMLPFALFAIRSPRPGEVEPEPGDDAGDPNGAGADLGLAAALRTRSFWLISFALFSYFFYFVGVLDHIQLLLRDAGLSKREAASAYGTAVFMGLFAKPLFGLVADLMPPRASSILNTLVYALSAFLVLGLPHPVILWVWVVAYGWTSTARDVIYPLLIMHGFGVRNMAAIYGAISVALLGGPLGSITAAAIHESTGSYDRAFILFGALNLLSVGALALVRHERTPPPLRGPGPGRTAEN